MHGELLAVERKFRALSSTNQILVCGTETHRADVLSAATTSQKGFTSLRIGILRDVELNRIPHPTSTLIKCHRPVSIPTVGIETGAW